MSRNDIPDLRSFPMSGGVDYGNSELDRAERDYEEEQDEIRSNADEPEPEDEEEEEDEDYMTCEDMLDSMHRPEV